MSAGTGLVGAPRRLHHGDGAENMRKGVGALPTPIGERAKGVCYAAGHHGSIETSSRLWQAAQRGGEGQSRFVGSIFFSFLIGTIEHDQAGVKMWRCKFWLEG